MKVRASLLLSVLIAMPTLPIAASSAAKTVPARTTEAAALDAGKRKAVLDAAIVKMRADYVFPEKVPAIAKALAPPSPGANTTP